MTRTGVCALAALMVLGGIELTGQRQPAEPPIRRIDHVMIKADDPREVLALFTETLGLPIAWPLEERGGVASGGVGFGNVNVEAIRFPGQKRLPSRAQLTGFGFEPSSLRACLDELQRRGVPYGPLRPLIVTDLQGAKQTLFTNVTLLGLSDTDHPVDATMHIFLSEYSPAYVDVAGRRARLANELAASGGGPLGVDSIGEVVVGAADVENDACALAAAIEPDPPSSWRLAGRRGTLDTGSPREREWRRGTRRACHIARACEGVSSGQRAARGRGGGCSARPTAGVRNQDSIRGMSGPVE